MDFFIRYLITAIVGTALIYFALPFVARSITESDPTRQNHEDDEAFAARMLREAEHFHSSMAGGASSDASQPPTSSRTAPVAAEKTPASPPPTPPRVLPQPPTPPITPRVEPEPEPTPQKSAPEITPPPPRSEPPEAEKSAAREASEEANGFVPSTRAIPFSAANVAGWGFVEKETEYFFTEKERTKKTLTPGTLIEYYNIRETESGDKLVQCRIFNTRGRIWVGVYLVPREALAFIQPPRDKVTIEQIAKLSKYYEVTEKAKTLKRERLNKARNQNPYFEKTRALSRQYDELEKTCEALIAERDESEGSKRREIQERLSRMRADRSRLSTQLSAAVREYESYKATHPEKPEEPPSEQEKQLTQLHHSLLQELSDDGFSL